MKPNAVRNLSWLGTLIACSLITACGAPPPSVQLSRPDSEPRAIVIQNVSVLDTISLQIRPSMDVMLKDGLIAAVVPSGQLQSAAGAQLISGDGATLVPGLIDMHGHVYAATGPTWNRSAPDPEANLRAYVYSGVTTVFDPSDASGEPAAGELPIQFADFAIWQREALQGEEFEGHLAYWTERLDGDLPALALPTDRPRQ